MFKTIFSTGFLILAGISALNGCGYSRKNKTVKVEMNPTPYVGTRKAVLTQPLDNADFGVRLTADLPGGAVASAFIPPSAIASLPVGTTATMFVETSSKVLEDYGIPEGSSMISMKLESTNGEPISEAPVIYTTIKFPEKLPNICEDSPYKVPREHLMVTPEGEISTVPAVTTSELSKVAATDKSETQLKGRTRLFDDWTLQEEMDNAAMFLPIYPYPELGRDLSVDPDLSGVDLSDTIEDSLGSSDPTGEELPEEVAEENALVLPLVPLVIEQDILPYGSVVSIQCGCDWRAKLPRCGCNAKTTRFELADDTEEDEQVESGEYSAQIARKAPMPKGINLKRSDFPYPEIALTTKTKKNKKTKRIKEGNVIFSEAWKEQWRQFLAGDKWQAMLKDKELDPAQVSMVISAKAAWDDCTVRGKAAKSKVLRYKFLMSDFESPGDLAVELPLKDPDARVGVRRCLKVDFNRSFFIEKTAASKLRNCGSEFTSSDKCLANTKELISHDINLTILAKSKIARKAGVQTKLLADSQCPAVEEDGGVLFAPSPDGTVLSPVAVTTEAEEDDTTVPVAGTALSFTDVGDSSITVNWGEASDNTSSASDIQYRLVRSVNALDIDSIEEVDALASGVLFDYKYETSTYTNDSLNPGTTYSYAVVAKDEAGNKVLYGPTSQATSGQVNPVAGTALAFTNLSHAGLTASWGAASDSNTAPTDLHYKLVKASSAAAIDTVAEADLQSGADILMDWTANTLSKVVTGLDPATTYFMAVLVKDSDGNMDLYAPQSTTTVNPYPIVGTAISFNGITATTITVNWGAATDSVTAAANLEYKLVKGTSLTDIDTVAEADAKTGANLLIDWTANTLTQALTGLATGTSFHFAVLVRDADGFKSLYAPSTQATVDQTAPTIGTVQKFSAVSGNSITVTWGAASDNLSSASQLQYKLVMDQTAANIDSVSDADAIAGAGLIMDWTANTLSATAGGLTADTKYFFVVLVKDEANNKAIYSERPRPTGKMIYTSAADHNGFFGATAAAAMAAADDFCSNKRLDTTATDVPVKAMLASSIRRACTNANCTDPLENLDWVLAPSTIYHNGDGDLIGQTNAAGIFSFPTTGALCPNIWIFPWSGLQADWRTHGNTCSDWTSTGGTGRAGQKGQVSGTPLTTSAISGIDLSCSVSSFYVYYCAEQ